MKSKGKFLTSIAVAFVVLTFLASTAFAPPPHELTINYQGYLEDSGGTPVNGTVGMKFSIYDVSTRGASLWSENQGSVAVTDGAFSVVLGSVTPINLAFDVQYYLGVDVGDDGEMTPRAEFVSVPYAMRARAADLAYSVKSGVVTSSGIADGTITNADISPTANIAASKINTTGLDADLLDGADSTAFLDKTTYDANSDGKADSAERSDNSADSDALEGYTLNDIIALLDGRYRLRTITIVDSAGNVGQYTSIAIGTDGLPVISYFDEGYADLKVAHCGDTSCSSGNTITTVDSAGSVGWFTSIAIGADGLPVISYRDETNQNLKVLHCGDASCTPATNTITTVDSTGDVGRHTSIAIGADGLPVVSYFDDSNGNLKVAHCGDASCFAGNTINTVDSAGDVGQYTSIAIGTDDLPVVSYYGSGLRVLHCGDASCSSGNTITTVDSAGSVGYYTSIAIGADDLPVVSYFDLTNYDLKVLHCGNASCISGNNTITTVDSAGNVGAYTSIAVGADGLPVVSYQDYANYDLKVAHCGNASCSSGNTITTVDSAGVVGAHTSIAVGADGLPMVSYYDVTNGDLKVAHCLDAECTVW